MNILIIIGSIILLLSIILYFTYYKDKNSPIVTPTQQPSLTPQKQPLKQTNAECRVDNMEDYYSFGEPKSVKDILESLKTAVSQYIRIIKNYIKISKEDFTLSPNVVTDSTKLDPNSFYYMGFRKTSNVSKPGNPPSFKWCEEFPDVVYKKLDPPELVTGPTGWSIIKNLDRRAPYKLNSNGEVVCATTPSGACMWQPNDDAALNIINSPTFNPTTTYTCKGNTEPWCKQSVNILASSFAPCLNYKDTDPASTVSVKCLQKTWLDLGCSPSKKPSDNYIGWWLDNNGAGTFGGIKADIKSWATLTDDNHRYGCYGDKSNWPTPTWKYVNGINVPLALTSNFDIECLSTNSKDCMWQSDEASTKKLLENIPIPNSPLVCGDMHNKLYGSPGYNDQNHWCSKGMKELNPTSINPKYTLTKNTDIPGNDIKCYFDGSLAKRCQDECLNNPDCKATNYIYPNGVWGNASGCCLKTVSSPTNPQNGIDFYVKNTTSLSQFKDPENVDYWSANINHISSSDPETCAKNCIDTPNCNLFITSTDSQDCWLKSTLDNRQPLIKNRNTFVKKSYSP